jgi:myo-inositol-1-phosphate synthase
MSPAESRTGVWIVGAFGSLATTVIVGARAVARALADPIGLVSEDPTFSGLGLAPLDSLSFGGHDIRKDTVADAAQRISRENGSLQPAWLTDLREELSSISAEVRPGIARGGGAAIEALEDAWAARSEGRGRDCVERLTSDIRAFQKSSRVERVIVVNLASTEPPVSMSEEMNRLESLEAELDRESPGTLRPGTLYAYAAMKAGAAFVNFTASPSCLCPSIQQLAAKCRLPISGNDGKTGETLVKSGLAPLFRLRRLQVLSWVGYNVLGNRDGSVLDSDENKRSKVGTKDSVVTSILGYPLRTHVGIDYVPSLGDSKVAWDFIHFRGFLGHPMAMQFTWQGCDSILAAPLVLDLVRFAELSLRRGESGPMTHLSSFFKSPIGEPDHDLYRQYGRLVAYAASKGGGAR